jgi:hypothetical protein
VCGLAISFSCDEAQAKSLLNAMSDYIGQKAMSSEVDVQLDADRQPIDVEPPAGTEMPGRPVLFAGIV